MFWCEHANKRMHVNEHSRLSGWVISNILAHLAHLAQFYFSQIFITINTYNCFWFHLTNEKIRSDWRQKFGEKWPMLTTFFLTTTTALEKYRPWRSKFSLYIYRKWGRWRRLFPDIRWPPNWYILPWNGA